MPDSLTTLYLPARIVGARMGMPADPDLDRINALFAAEPLAAEQVFVFDAIASSDAIDAYYTRMDVATTLPNYVADLAAGAALLDSHDAYRLPFGSSFRAELQPVEDGVLEGVPATTQVYAGYYMLRNHVVNGTNTEEYRTGIIGGTHRKMSIGFGGPDITYVCDIDGSDLFSYDSAFYPGMRLADGTIVTYTIKHARALETSVVFKNASPGALIQRVQALVDQRAIPGGEVARLEARWGVRFAGKPQQYFIGGVQHMDEKQIKYVVDGVQTRAGKKLSAATREKLSGAVKSAEDLIATLSDLLAEAADEVEEGRSIKAELGEAGTIEGIRTLKASAAAGESYRADLIAETVKARVAVAGDAFDKTRYEKRLASYDLDDLKDERETWTAQRAAAYTPGRIVPTVDVAGETASRNEYLDYGEE